MAVLVVERRHQGPPGCANGGWVGGLLGGRGPAEVTLRRPVPLERPLEHRDGRLLEDGDVLAEATPASVEVDVPRPVDVVSAREAASRTPLAARHPFPGCFGCGPEHPDGLHNLAGPVEGREGVWAVDWTPEDVSVPMVWAALDCPSSAPVVPLSGNPPHVLGRIAARIDELPAAGEPHVVMAWAEEQEGRRKHSASVLLDREGRTLAVARATWIALVRR